MILQQAQMPLFSRGVVVILLSLMLMVPRANAQPWEAPPAKNGAAHSYVKPCGDADYLTSTGVQCTADGSKSMITSDSKATPQERVKCHPATPGQCKPWYWCEQYGRPMDVLFILDSSKSIGNKWKTMLEVVVALLEGMEETVYPNVQCDENYRTNGGTCKFRMGMQIWGRSNDNSYLCGKQTCTRNGGDTGSWSCTGSEDKGGGGKCKLRKSAKTLPCYYPDTTIPPQNMISGDSGGVAMTHRFDPLIKYPNRQNNWLPHMLAPMSPTRSVNEYRGWADTRNPAEWAAQGKGATNQVAYLTEVAKDWRDNWYDCFPRTQWTKPFLDCLYSVRKENPLANQEDDAFRLCIMVTDGAPYRDSFPDGNDSPRYSNMKWAQKEVKKAGVETVGVYLQTGGSASRNQMYTYCISSCFDKTDEGKALGNDANGHPNAYDFDACTTFLNSKSTSGKIAVYDSCEFYIDGNVKSTTDLANIKLKVNDLVNSIAAASYTVSTQSSTVLNCDWASAVGDPAGTELCASNRCLQVNREAWVCWKGHEQGSDSTGATTCTKCKPGHYRNAFDGDAFCKVRSSIYYCICFFQYKIFVDSQIFIQLCYYFHCVAPSQPHPRSVRLESSVHSRVEPNVAHVPKVNIQVRAQDNLILDVHAHLQINLDVQVILVHAHMKDAYAVKPAHLDTTVVF